MMKVWLQKHPDEPLPWLERCHQAFLLWFETQDRPIRDLVDHRTGTRLAAKKMLAQLGVEEVLKADINAIEADAKRYLMWLGFKNVHLLVIGRIHLQPESLPTELHTGYILARQLICALQQALYQQYYSEAQRFDPELHLAALVISLALGDGALSAAEINAAVREISGGRLYRLDSLLYVRYALLPDGGHMRRLFLSPVTAGLALSYDVSGTGEHTGREISRALKKVPRDWLPTGSRPLSLKALCEAGSVHFRLQPEVPHHLVDYMTGKIMSNSVCEDRFVQLFGRKPLPTQTSTDLTVAARVSDTKAEATDAERVEHPGLINALKKALDPTRTPEPLTAALDLIRDSRAAGIPAMLSLLLDWVEWMLIKKEQQPSTARINLTALSQHLMPLLSSLEQTIGSPDEWETLFEEMTCGLKPKDKLFDAVRAMAQFLQSRTGLDYADAGFSAQATVNARTLSEVEIARCINLLHQRMPESRAVLAERLVTLALHLGCRRWELLGLQPRDVIGIIDPYINLHNNDLRDLKTLASRRLISLGFVKNEAMYQEWRAAVSRQASHSPEASIFESDGFDVREDEKVLFLDINKALQAASNNPDVSFHSLRHTTACRGLLAVYWDLLELPDLEQYPYFAEIRNRKIPIRAILVQENLRMRFEHETVSLQLGHLNYETTARHYFHFYCLMRYGFLRKVHGWLHDPDTIKLCLAAGGLNRQFQALRKSTQPSLQDVLDILAAKYLSRLHVYREKEVFVTTVNAKAAKPLLDELAMISKISQLPEHNRQVLLQEFAPDNEEFPIYLKAINRRIETMTVIMCRASRATVDQLSTWKIPKTSSARLALLHMAERFGAVASGEHGQLLQAQLVDGLMQLCSRLGRQLGGAFRFKTGEDARLLLTHLTNVFGADNVRFETHIERSQRAGGTVRKVSGPKIIRQNIDGIDHGGTGNLVVRVINGGDNSVSYKPEAFLWFCATVYVRYGAHKTNGAVGQE